MTPSEPIRSTHSANMCTTVIVLALLFLPSLAVGQSLPKVRMAYTSIAIQFTPVYLMKELDLPRKQGLDVEILMIPVSSRAVQAALAGEIQFMTSGGIANINANMAALISSALHRRSTPSFTRLLDSPRSRNRQR